jgi:cardiolipin synthase A/B
MTASDFQVHFILYALHALAILCIAVRVIMRRPAPGTALAWLFLVAALPFGGAVLYLLVGERRVGLRRARGIAALRSRFRGSVDDLPESCPPVDWTRHGDAAQHMDHLGRTVLSAPTVPGCALQLFGSAEEVFPALIRDIDEARHGVLMEFYIWNAGGAADQVLEALLRAAARGVPCRVLVDALGGHAWWRSPQPERLRLAGVEVLPALPTGLLRVLTGRNDLRLHRKIVVLDGSVAWTGSMNMVDPRYFKQQAHVGQWKDAMVRVQGPAVTLLARTLLSDWALECEKPPKPLDQQLELPPQSLPAPRGEAAVQVLPSGPGAARGIAQDGILQMLLALINAARTELVLTTPYFVPDEALLRALRGAAGRGVRVRLVLPARVDSFMTRLVTRSYYDELMEMGVEILLYRKGLLHTKSITADDTLAMFGTVNLDMRSIWLNYEVSLFVYDREFALALRALQESYMADADPLAPQRWARRSLPQRFVENAFRMAGPLL